MEIAVGDARAAQQKHLQEPVQQDGDLAEEERAIDVRRDQHIVNREKRHRQYGGSAKNIVEIGNRGKPPLVAVQVEDEIDRRRVDQEDRQELETGQPFIQRLTLEPDKKRQHDRRRGGGEIVQHDQNLARGQFRQPCHFAVFQTKRCFTLFAGRRKNAAATAYKYVDQCRPFPVIRELYREFAVYSVFKRRGSRTFARISRRKQPSGGGGHPMT